MANNQIWCVAINSQDAEQPEETDFDVQFHVETDPDGITRISIGEDPYGQPWISLEFQQSQLDDLRRAFGWKE